MKSSSEGADGSTKDLVKVASVLTISELDTSIPRLQLETYVVCSQIHLSDDKFTHPRLRASGHTAYRCTAR